MYLKKNTFHIPPSKSHSIRAGVFATMAAGTSTLKGLLHSPDIQAALNAAAVFGAKVCYTRSTPAGIDVTIEGVNGKPRFTSDEIDVGNSGQVLRFFGALAALSPQPMLFKGDGSISSQRTVQPLIDALIQAGASAKALNENGLAPMRVQGPMRPSSIWLCGRDSQPVSGMLMATAFLPGSSTICAHNPGELPWVALTLSWLKRLGIGFIEAGVGTYHVEGSAQYAALDYTPPADFSSAAFPAVAALLSGQEVTLSGLDWHDVQGDKLLFSTLSAMGGQIHAEPENRLIHVKPSAASLKALHIDVNPMIDALPILAVLGCFTNGQVHLTGGLAARGKECDRISVMASALKRLGADIEEEKEGLRIFPSTLRAPAEDLPFSSFKDHRIAMALTVAAMRISGTITITEAACIKKSYPTFLQDMRAMGMTIHEEPDGVLRVKGMQ